MDNPYIHVKWTHPMIHRILEAARINGLTKSEYVRQAIIEKLNREEKDTTHDIAE